MPYKTLNREHKFRAWIAIPPSKNISYLSGNIEEDKTGYMSRYFWFTDFDGDYFIPNSCEIDDMTIMQYIGLKDSNNKEIYEGDFDKAFGVIIMDYGCFIGRAFALSEEGEEEKIDTILGHTSQNQREIIGNIYENPELINDKVGNAI